MYVDEFEKAFKKIKEEEFVKKKKIKYESFQSNTIKFSLGQEIKKNLTPSPHLVGVLCKCFNPPHPVKPLFT